MDTFKAEIKKMIALFNNNLNVSLIEFLDKLSLYKKIKVQIIVCIFICLFLINGCQKDYLYSDVFIEELFS